MSAADMESWDINEVESFINTSQSDVAFITVSVLKYDARRFGTNPFWCGSLWRALENLRARGGYSPDERRIRIGNSTVKPSSLPRIMGLNTVQPDSRLVHTFDMLDELIRRNLPGIRDVKSVLLRYCRYKFTDVSIQAVALGGITKSRLGYQEMESAGIVIDYQGELQLGSG